MNEAPRSACVVLRTQSVYFSLYQEWRTKCIRDYEKAMIAERIKVLHRTPAFRSWPKADCKRYRFYQRAASRCAKLFLSKAALLILCSSLRAVSFGLSRGKASDLGLGIVGCHLQKGVDNEQTVHLVTVLLNVCTYMPFHIFGAEALLPKAKNHVAKVQMLA